MYALKKRQNFLVLWFWLRHYTEGGLVFRISRGSALPNSLTQGAIPSTESVKSLMIKNIGSGNDGDIREQEETVDILQEQ
jgi:hypothetical protein